MDKKAKDPLVALVASFLVPGAGHVYAGKPLWGALLFLAITAQGVWPVSRFLDPASKVEAWYFVFSAFSFLLYLGSLPHAYLSAKKYNALNNLKSPVAPGRKKLLIAVFLAAVLAYSSGAVQIVSFVRTALYRTHTALPDSMEPTIYPGERLLIDLSAYKKSPPKRGDIVLYRYPPEQGKLYLHRIVGFGGESVALIDHKIVINGSKLTDPWAVKVRHYNGGTLARKGMKPVVVPQGSYYVLGDNASRSQDSRYWGCLQKEYVLGRAVKIYYPFKRSGPVE